jgi:hypothetical protein
MTNTPESKVPSACARVVLRALRRAADDAREIARQTGTKLVIVRDGVLTEIDPDDPYLDELKAQSEADDDGV